MEYTERLALQPRFDIVERAIDDAFGDGFLAVDLSLMACWERGSLFIVRNKCGDIFVPTYSGAPEGEGALVVGRDWPRTVFAAARLGPVKR